MRQIEKIFALMCYNREKREWFFPPDFMKPELGDLFVGYEASARLSDLARKYPDMIESLKRGKYMYRRIKWEKRGLWIDSLPENLRSIEARYQ